MAPDREPLQNALHLSRRGEITDDLSLLLNILPSRLREVLEQEDRLDTLIEIVLDLGRPPEARFPHCAVYFKEFEVSREDIEHVVNRVGTFTGDNRAGIERTLHRISAIRNRRGIVVGLTCRVGRAITGTVDIIKDRVETGLSLLLLGPPGVGKTTLLREAARVLADEMQKRVVVVDTSNEIAGDGDVPHPAIGHARRMQVPSPELQHQVMIEAVENHMPEVIVIDEIGTELEASAARTIAERGVQLVATAHGITMDNLVMNPTLADLVGGIQAVTLSDEEARRRGTQKTVLERKAPPTFDILVEIKDRDRFAVYPDLAAVVDHYLAGAPLRPEVRVRSSDGNFTVQEPLVPRTMELSFSSNVTSNGQGMPKRPRRRLRRPARIYPIGVSRTRLEKAIREVGAPAKLADQPINADIVLSLKAQRKKQPRKLQSALDRGVEFYTIKSNTFAQIKEFLTLHFETRQPTPPQPEVMEEEALHDVEDAIIRVQRSGEPVELPALNSYLRRRQHEIVQEHGLRSESVGIAPFRRVIIFPE
ncbi:MAG: AAA family ATPase [Acidobacteriota bacterium]|nr:MAG: AAA family ATPase [Acidobacteriota bacterium]